ncbi:MAG: BON domain-containing protein [Nitrospiraceae bacterium]
MRRLRYCLILALTLTVPGCDYVRHPDPATRISDDALSQRVRDALLESQQLNLSHIDVSAERGAVYLSGEADSSESKAVAGRIARGINGVRKVINKADVQP